MTRPAEKTPREVAEEVERESRRLAERVVAHDLSREEIVARVADAICIAHRASTKKARITESRGRAAAFREAATLAERMRPTNIDGLTDYGRGRDDALAVVADKARTLAAREDGHDAALTPPTPKETPPPLDATGGEWVQWVCVCGAKCNHAMPASDEDYWPTCGICKTPKPTAPAPTRECDCGCHGLGDAPLGCLACFTRHASARDAEIATLRARVAEAERSIEFLAATAENRARDIDHEKSRADDLAKRLEEAERIAKGEHEGYVQNGRRAALAETRLEEMTKRADAAEKRADLAEHEESVWKLSSEEHCRRAAAAEAKAKEAERERDEFRAELFLAAEATQSGARGMVSLSEIVTSIRERADAAEAKADRIFAVLTQREAEIREAWEEADIATHGPVRIADAVRTWKQRAAAADRRIAEAVAQLSLIEPPRRGHVAEALRILTPQAGTEVEG